MIRVGIGGWTFEPWRDGNFFPKKLPKARELEFASRKVTAIEINGTYYSTQKPSSFKRWHDETPDDFVFAVKANRFATNRKVLADAAESITRFVESGLSELKRKLGPILWQFMPTKKFDAQDFGAFLSLLPDRIDGLALRHAIEVRHESFLVPEFVALARKFGVAIVLADSAKYPMLADVTADFVYARLQNAQAKLACGYSAAEIGKWAKRARLLQSGAAPGDLPALAKPAAKKTRDVFVFMINGAKERAPAAAMALLEKLH